MTLTRIALAPAMASFLIPFYCRYRDIADVLHQLAVHAGKCSTSLRIYDPYFCEGSVVLHLRALGFTNVYNRNEDFYAQISGQCLPPPPPPPCHRSSPNSASFAPLQAAAHPILMSW